METVLLFITEGMNFMLTTGHVRMIMSQWLSVKVDFTIATCPKCGTVYSLSASGTPASGVGRYPLKNYRTSAQGLEDNRNLLKNYGTLACALW